MAAVHAMLTIDDALAVCRNLPLDDRQVAEAMSGEPYNPADVALAAMFYQGLHWSVLSDRDGELLAVGGFIRQRPGVFRTWLYATGQAWTSCGADLTTIVRDTIRRVLDEKLAHRIETVTLASKSLTRDWYGKIGLTYEATLRGFCATGEDAVMYVAVRDPEKT